MTANPHPAPAKKPSFTSIDHEIRTLMAGMDDEEPISESQSVRMERLLALYTGVAPLLTTISTLPILPARWRSALVLFNQAFAAVAAGAAAVSDDDSGIADFKAGKDL
jgi:hypothetical protein